MYTTLNKIRLNCPCDPSWKKLLASLGKTEADDAPVSLRYILDNLGLDDALWALRAVDGIDRECRLFACRRAESVLDIYELMNPGDSRPRRAIEVARSYADGIGTQEELRAASHAAYASARVAGNSVWETLAADASVAAAWALPAMGARSAAGAAANVSAYDAAGATSDSTWAAVRADFIKTFCHE
jgi:hypothetical protein